MERKQILPGGATRSEEAPAYCLVPREGFRRTAQRFALGAKKHGRDNWRRAFTSEQDAREFCDAAYDHMMEHAMKMGAGEDRLDDHLGAIGWAVFVLAYAEMLFGKPWTQLERRRKVRR